MYSEQDIFNRTERLLGSGNMERLHEIRVIIFGVGGVGSWCAEGLIRSGVVNLTIVDSDCVSVSNINRQAMAYVSTVGDVKVDALRKRLLDINPHANIEAVEAIYSCDTATMFGLDTYDFVIDAIDSLSAKLDLILHATSLPKRVAFFSSMGSALKMDANKIRVGEFWEIKGCPLARALRKRMKSQCRYPSRKFLCVFSPEVLPNRGELVEEPAMTYGDSTEKAPHDWNQSKAQINGSMVHITAIFGFTLTSLVIRAATEA